MRELKFLFYVKEVNWHASRISQEMRELKSAIAALQEAGSKVASRKRCVSWNGSYLHIINVLRRRISQEMRELKYWRCAYYGEPVSRISQEMRELKL